jgi:hypothetical protein
VFITGKNYCIERLDKLKMLPHTNVLSETKLFKGMEYIEFIEIEITKKMEEDECYLLWISFSNFAPHSGPCGADGSNGYCWLHFRNQEGKWVLMDDWIFSASDCHGNEVVLHEVNESQSVFFVADYNGKKIDDSECFEFNPNDIFEKPKPCVN